MIALHGSYYGDNFGDTLYVVHFINWLKETGKISNEDIVLPFASNRVRSLVKVSKLRGIKALISCSKFVFIGGGYLGEPPTNKIIWGYRLVLRHLSIALIAYLLNKPYIFIGVGAGPVSNKIAKCLMVFVCNHSEKVLVRDIESFDYLIEYGVKKDKLLCTADPLLTFNTYENIACGNDFSEFARSDTRIIGVHLPIGDKSDVDKIAIIINALKDYCQQLDKYKLVVFNDFYKKGYNYIALDILKNHFPGEDIFYHEYKNPFDLINLIEKTDILLTTKLHCGVIANCLGKYTISIPHHSKTPRFYRQINLADMCVPLENVNSKDVILNILSKFDQNKKRNTNIPLPVRELANINKKVLFEFVFKHLDIYR